MILACPDCSTRFRVPDGVLPAEGRTVRCRLCSHEWLAHPEDGLPDDAADDAADENATVSETDGPPAEAPTEAPTEAPEAVDDVPDDSGAETGTGAGDVSRGSAGYIQSLFDGSGDAGAEPPGGPTGGPDEVDLLLADKADVFADDALDDEPGDAGAPAGEPAPGNLKANDAEQIDGGISALLSGRRGDRGSKRRSLLEKSGRRVSPIAIGWAGLVVFLALVLGGSLVFHQTISHAWPASERLFTALGFDESGPRAGHAEDDDHEAEPATTDDDGAELTGGIDTGTALDPEKPLDWLRIIRTTMGTENRTGTKVFVFDLEIRNTGARDYEVPLIIGQLTDAGKIPVHRWEIRPEPRFLNAGNTMIFRSEVVDPPAGAANYDFDWAAAQ